jgi:hypothetical protein
MSNLHNQQVPMPPSQPLLRPKQKHKASTDTEAQPKRQKSIPIPTFDLAPPSQPESADATKQAVDPPAQGTSSAVISQGPTIDEIMEELPSNLAPVNLEVEDIPSASSADPSHGIL